MNKKPNAIKQIGGNVGFGMNKSRGQHLLKNKQIIEDIVKKSGLTPSQIVLEIGPGTGNLTDLLLDKSKFVYAVEIDVRMISQLIKRFSASENYNKLKIIQGDVLKINPLPAFDLCIANIPYQISSPIVFKLLSHRPMFKCAVLLVQKEFAMRLIAKPNSEFYCRLSANVSLLAKCDHIIKVGKNNFNPPPKVDSSVVRIEPIFNIPNINYIEWDGLLRICFSRKNKTLGAIFKQKKIVNFMYKLYKEFLIYNNNFNITDENIKLKDNSNNIEQLFKEDDYNIDDKYNSDDELDNKKNNTDLDCEFKENISDDEHDIINNSKLKKKMFNKNKNLFNTKISNNENNEEFEKFKLEIKNILSVEVYDGCNSSFSDSRAVKLNNDNFLRLLNCFNQKGIHFK